MSDPLISAIMVTSGSPERRPLAIAAIESFRQQIDVNKELVIINYSQSSLLAELPPELVPAEAREVLVERPPTLGDLRNRGLQEARGDYLVPWDDDDWSHPDRLKTQLQHASRGRVVLLSREVRYSFLNRNAFVFTFPKMHGLPGTAFFPRTTGRYESINKHEDSHFLSNFASILTIDKPAHLHLRFFHGKNTWDSRHIMRRYAREQRPWDMDEQSAVYLKSVLEQHYSGISV